MGSACRELSGRIPAAKLPAFGVSPVLQEPLLCFRIESSRCDCSVDHTGARNGEVSARELREPMTIRNGVVIRECNHLAFGGR